ncbi:hypothetical protein BDZ91DRAFT_787372 [Kalaharituber pfeilii]|nr:hypothetical protein BDZ91DRAFT_787372 [Kalaharituber pfeilii]
MRDMGRASPHRLQDPPYASSSHSDEHTTEALSFSTIDIVHSEEPSPPKHVTAPPAPAAPTPTPGSTPTPANPRKRKGKMASITDPNALKRQLDDKEAKKIATAPAVTQDSPPVVHGVALRKNLGNVQKWLGSANKDLGKFCGIRWLRKKEILMGGEAHQLGGGAPRGTAHTGQSETRREMVKVVRV